MALSANPAAAGRSKGEKTKGLMVGNTVIISNYSITALPFQDFRDSTVVILRHFTTSDATVITFLISNLAAGGRAKLLLYSKAE